MKKSTIYASIGVGVFAIILVASAAVSMRGLEFGAVASPDIPCTKIVVNTANIQILGELSSAEMTVVNIPGIGNVAVPGRIERMLPGSVTVCRLPNCLNFSANGVSVAGYILP